MPRSSSAGWRHSSEPRSRPRRWLEASPRREDVDAIAAKARENGTLWWEPREMPDPIGYICAVHDPDGNVVEFSHNQRVYETVRRLWGPDRLPAT